MFFRKSAVINAIDIEAMILDAAIFLETISYLCIIDHVMDRYNDRDESSDSFLSTGYFYYQIMFLLSMMIFNIYGRYCSNPKPRQGSFNATQEIARSKKAFKDKYPDNSKSDYVRRFEVDVSSPKKISISHLTQHKHHFHHVKTWWSVGSKELLNEAYRVRYIFNYLPPDMQIEKSINELNWWYQLRPHVNKINDMPSKTRWLLVAMYLDYMYQTFNPQDSTSSYWSNVLFIMTLAFVQLGVNYILNNKQLEYNLEGYSYLYGSYISRYPTCIGQQLTADFVLFENYALKQTLTYLYSAYNMLEMNKDRLSVMTLPDEAKSGIVHFTRFFKEHSNYDAVLERYRPMCDADLRNMFL